LVLHTPTRRCEFGHKEHPFAANCASRDPRYGKDSCGTDWEDVMTRTVEEILGKISIAKPQEPIETAPGLPRAIAASEE
jgi:hypothetical protein